MLPLLQEFVGSDDAITPLGEAERHRIVFVQEIGGFSLRCIDGMRELQQSYQDWKGQMILAKRAQLRGESRDLPIPVHIQKEPPFWDVFPENPTIFNLVIQVRALGVLSLEENRSLKEKVVRYVRQTAIGQEKVDVASSWEETSQVLEIPACRDDRQEIQRQVAAKLAAVTTEKSKRSLYESLTAYLNQRETELEKEGGKDSLSYKREAKIVLDLINAYKLYAQGGEIKEIPTAELPVVTPPNQGATRPVEPRTHVFCNSCGTKNPVNSKFCAKCGTRLQLG